MYAGPLRDEPLAVELHNTIYAAGGARRDGLDQSEAWLEAVADRLPEVPGAWPAADELMGLRGPVRAALHGDHGTDVLAALNGAAARAPRSPAIVRSAGGVEAAIDHHGASRADVVLGAFAASAIELITGPHRDDLRVCGAPGCVLMFLRHHPRRAWCSNACGNRARQARHYRRTRGA